MSGQNLYLELYPTDTDTTTLQEYIKPVRQHRDTFSLYAHIFEMRTTLQNAGYLEASADSLIWRDSVLTAHLHLGQQYEWAILENGNVAQSILEKIGFRENLYQKKPFHHSQIKNVQQSILKHLENNGFPFAKVWLEDIYIKESQVSAKIYTENGKLIKFKGVDTGEYVNISKQYLENYLGIKAGDIYSKQKVLEVSQRIRELPFVKEKKTAVVLFEEKEATVNLFLDKKRASRFDFLIGLLPGEREDVNGVPVQRLLITGELNAELQNQFGKGERIAAKFERLRPSVQELELEFSYPYILELPFGADAAFRQFRRDSSFNNIAFDAGVRYLLEGGNYLKAFYTRSFTNLQLFDKDRVIRTHHLPENLDLSKTGFGLEYAWSKLDYRYNPRKGWSFLLNANASVKNIERNTEIEELIDPDDLDFKFSSLYDSLELRSFQYNIEGEVARYFRMGKSSTLKSGLTMGYILSRQPIYQNEQFRIGGNRLLRGFDEESLYTTAFAVAILEYRLLIGQNSYFYVFGDYAYTENVTTTVNRIDRLYGLGGGLTFETKAGIFGVSLAVGSEQRNALNLRNPKVHFGYVNLF